MNERQRIQNRKWKAGVAQPWGERRSWFVSTPMQLGLGFFCLLVVCLLTSVWVFALDVRFGLGAWDGWPMVEAIGTVLAVFAAIGLAWWEASRSRRQQQRQIKFVRLLLGREIRANVLELASVEMRIFETYGELKQPLDADKDKRWRDVTYDPLPQLPQLLIRADIKTRLEEQFGLSSQSFTVWEIDQVDAFYYGLDLFKSELEEVESIIDPDSVMTLADLYNVFSRVVRSVDRLALQRKGFELVKHLEMSPEDSERRSPQ